MRIDDMDDYSVNLADAYAKDAYQKGYEQGGMDAVKHGHWIEGYPTETTDYFSCSVCNAGIFVDNSWRVGHKDILEIHRYCRGCGAKMDKKEE